MSLKTKIAVSCLAPLAFACAGARATSGPPRDPRDVRGEHLYRVSCGGCHRLRDPAELTATKWKAAVREHSDDAKLSAADEALVRDFLVRHAAGAVGEGRSAPAALPR